MSDDNPLNPHNHHSTNNNHQPYQVNQQQQQQQQQQQFNHHHVQGFTLSSPSINNIIEAAGYGQMIDPDDVNNMMELHTGWTPLIKQSISDSNKNDNDDNNNTRNNINNNNNNNNDNYEDGRSNDIYNGIYSRSSGLGHQYQHLYNQFSSPSKIESNSVNIERLMAIENEFMDGNNNNNNGNFPLLLSTTPMNSRSSGFLLQDLFMDTPNLSLNNNGNNEEQQMESPTKLMQQQQGILFNATQKRLTPYKLQYTPGLIYPETPGTKFVRSLLELPVTTTPPLPPPPPSLSRVNHGSPLKDSFTASASNNTPLTRKSHNYYPQRQQQYQLQKKRKLVKDFYETPERKKKLNNISSNITPLKQQQEQNEIGSSPSTIKVTSISPSTKQKKKSSSSSSSSSTQHVSPTPISQRTSNTTSSSSVQLSNSFQPPPIGTFKKEEKPLIPISKSIPKSCNINTTNSNNTNTNNNNNNNNTHNGKNTKFQIIFQDVNSLMKKSMLKNKKIRSKSGILLSNNTKKNLLTRSNTFTSGSLSNNKIPLLLVQLNNNNINQQQEQEEEITNLKLKSGTISKNKIGNLKLNNKFLDDKENQIVD